MPDADRDPMALNQSAAEKIKVWDPMVRVFHWSLVISFTICYLTQETEYELHINVGYAVLGLMVFRIFWGFSGPTHARFSDFVYPPQTTLPYLMAILKGHPRRYLGHDPAGGMMILATLACLIVVAVSGIALDAAENRAGPLADTSLFRYTHLIAETHEASTTVALVLIAMHLLGVLVSSRIHGENLVLTMITGKKRVD